MVVARRFEHLFRTRKPAIKEWERYDSLHECLDDLSSAGQPIDYVFDDHLHHLAAQLLEHEREYRRLGYVVTGAEEHYPYARLLVTCCDRVLVEKPVSKLVRDVHPEEHGRFRYLRALVANTDELGEIFGCEHYAFRKGFTDALPRLDAFIARHRTHRLRYHFSFFETAEREALAARPAAMQDGSLLDVAITHGLGPLTYLLWRTRDPVTRGTRCSRELTGEGHRRFDWLHDAITWSEVRGFQARERADPKAPLIVPVLAETAARVAGTCSVGGREIELLLESGKGAAKRDRFLRLECADCTRKVRRSKREADPVYFGISLGAAGYTVCDFAGCHESEEFAKAEEVEDDHPLKAPEFDGGWRSDRAGDRSEAEVAQAAMIEAFIAPDKDDRFIPIEETCQIVRLGMEAQALAFCDRRPAYTLDHDFGDDASNRTWPQWGEEEAKATVKPPRNVKSDHRVLKDLWLPTEKTPADDETSADDERSSSAPRKADRAGASEVSAARLLIRAVAPGLDPPSPLSEVETRAPELESARYRVVTVLGPEGLGNTDVAEILTEELERRRADVHLLPVGRDEQWCLGRGSGTSTEDRLVRDLVQALEIDSATVEDPAADLLKRIIECRPDLSKEQRILILNGVDRLGDKPWTELVGLLNQLPDSHRLLFVTNRGDRAVGPVFETAELVAEFRRHDGYAKRLEIGSYWQELHDAVAELFGRRGPSRTDRKDGDWVQREVQSRVRHLAQGNLTVERQLIRWLRDVVTPELSERTRDLDRKLSADRKQGRLSWRKAWGALTHALATLSVPRTITPFPERLLDRISLACLGALDEVDRRAVTALGRLSEGTPQETVLLSFPGFVNRASGPGPLRSVFLRTGARYKLFPRVRRAAVRTFEAALRSAGGPVHPAGRSGAGTTETGKEDEFKALLREVDDRRLLLALPEAETFDDDRLDRLLTLGERGIYGLGKLDLDGTLMEDLCLDLAEAFEVGVRGRIELRPARLIRLLIERPTNLGMLTRARLLSLYAWAGVGRTFSSAKTVGIMNRLADAGRVADRCKAFEDALGELDPEGADAGQHDPNNRAARRAERHELLRLESHRNLLAADLFRTLAWSRLLGLDTPSGYVFEQEESLLASRRAMERFVEEKKDKADPTVRRLRAQLLVVLGLHYAREPASESPLPFDRCYGAERTRRLFRGLEAPLLPLALGIQLTREALEINRALTRLGEPRRAGDELRPGARERLAESAARGACRNRLTLALLHCLLAEKARSPKRWRAKAAEEIAAAGEKKGPGDRYRCIEEPYYALVRARLLDRGIIPPDGPISRPRTPEDGPDEPTPAEKAVADAARGYRRRGQEYFAKLARKYGEELRKREEARRTPAESRER